VCAAGVDVAVSSLNSPESSSHFCESRTPQSMLVHLGTGAEGGSLPSNLPLGVKVLNLMLLICAGNSYLFKEQVEGNAILSSRCVLRNWICSFQRCVLKTKL